MRKNKKDTQMVRSDTLEQIAEMWQRLYAQGVVHSPFHPAKLDFLAKVFAEKREESNEQN